MTVEGHTPMYCAIRMERKDMALALAAMGADPTMSFPGVDKRVRADPPPTTPHPRALLALRLCCRRQERTHCIGPDIFGEMLVPMIWR